jgi:hypothetical protein
VIFIKKNKMSKSKNIQEANKNLEQRYLIKEESLKPCQTGEKGTLVVTRVNGKPQYALSKHEGYLGAFCIVPDSNTIKFATPKPGENIS